MPLTLNEVVIRFNNHHYFNYLFLNVLRKFEVKFEVKAA